MEKSTPNPLTIHHDGASIEEISGVIERPHSSNYSIHGAPWSIVNHRDYFLTIQQHVFFGNHMQLIELKSKNANSIRFSVETPTVFVIIVIEGLFRYYWNSKLVSYATGGILYMTYNPRTDFLLGTNPGNHAMMVVSLDPQWFVKAERAHSCLRELVRCIQSNAHQTVVSPMCRVTQPIKDLWDTMRIMRSDPFRHSVDLVTDLHELVTFYNGQLEEGNHLRGQLSVDIANKMYNYIQQHFNSDIELSIGYIAMYLKISPWKVREYSKLLFDKSIHKHVRSLRMIEAFRLLETTSLSVSDIAFQVGYLNIQHFYKIFQKFHETSPASCRKN